MDVRNTKYSASNGKKILSEFNKFLILVRTEHRTKY